MMRLTEKDNLGHWFLKGLEWGQLRAGQVITKDVEEKLYGALCKLKDYEDTECSPDGVEMLMEKYAEVAALLTVPAHEWIPVTKRLPEDDDSVLISFDNIPIVANGYYETYEDGSGAWYIEGSKATCLRQGFIVAAWMPLPEPYRPEVEEKPDASPAWKGHYMDRFEKVE